MTVNSCLLNNKCFETWSFTQDDKKAHHHWFSVPGRRSKKQIKVSGQKEAQALRLRHVFWYRATIRRCSETGTGPAGSAPPAPRCTSQTRSAAPGAGWPASKAPPAALPPGRPLRPPGQAPRCRQRARGSAGNCH